MTESEAWDRLNTLTQAPMTEDGVAEVIALVETLQGAGAATDGHFWRRLPDVGDAVDKFTAKLREAESLQGLARTAARKEAGYIFEEVAACVVGGLMGWNRFRSYQSATLQHDVLLYGDGPAWGAVCRRLEMAASKTRLLVEVKATHDPIGVATFCRFCEAINAMQRVGLGLFISIDGIADFPGPDQPGHARSGAHLQQALFFARTGIPVVGISLPDIEDLRTSANLISIVKGRVDALVDLARSTEGSDPLRHIEGPTRVRERLTQLGGTEDDEDSTS